MAVNAYLKIDGRPGASTSKQDYIDVMSFSFGASMQHVIGPGSAGAESRVGRADVHNLTVMKVMDKTSPLLFDDCVTGNVLKTVDLIYDKPMGDQQEDYIKYPHGERPDYLHPAVRIEREPHGVDLVCFR